MTTTATGMSPTPPLCLRSFSLVPTASLDG